MKKVLLILMAAVSLNAFGAEVRGARVNLETGMLEVDVRYGGGCKAHVFELRPYACLETFPVRCTADLVDLTEGDFCEAILSRTVKFSLEEHGFTDSYYSNGILMIRGSDESTATVRLPE